MSTINHRHVVLAGMTISAAVLFLACGGGGVQPRQQATPAPVADQEASPTSQPELSEPAPEAANDGPSDAAPGVAAIPDDVTYAVINDEPFLNTKRSLDIRISRRVSEDVLRAIALELKQSDSASYERTFIVHYLPDMEVGAGGWATTHFNPDLEIKIQGLTAEAHETLMRQPDVPGREVVGHWLDDMLFSGNRITIFREDGKLFRENTYGDGSSGVTEMIEEAAPDGRKFQDVEPPPSGQFYVIDENGDLEIWDEDGYWDTAKRIQTASDLRVEAERQAASKLTLAKGLIENGTPRAAERWLNEIIENWPETEAAAEARQILEEIE